MSDFRYEKLHAHLPEARRDIGNSDFVPEAVEICPVCGDVACPRHPEEAPSLAERALTEATRAAAVVRAARACLDAWDASETVPPRLVRALADLDDSLARFDALPF